MRTKAEDSQRYGIMSSPLHHHALATDVTARRIASGFGPGNDRIEKPLIP
jgi:hypothetical protein